MFYRKTGLPEEGELVLCTVTDIQYSSVFVNIDDYNLSGMIHISEIAAGRIRNIRDYVKEGKKVVCKVLKVYKEKGHVDLSLRRVNERERKNKVNEIKLEQKAESIIEHVAKEIKIEPEKLYSEIAKNLLPEYGMLHLAFEDVVNGKLHLKEKIDKKYAEDIENLVIQRFKPKSVEIKGTMTITTYEPDGVEIIKKGLSSVESDNLSISYLGGGKYSFVAVADDFKKAEELLKTSVEKSTNALKNCIVEFKRA